MYTAYVRVTNPRRNGTPLGREGLRGLKLAFGEVVTHLGFPVVRVRTHGVEDFRTSYLRTAVAIEAQGYDWTAELTAAAERALSNRGIGTLADRKPRTSSK